MSQASHNYTEPLSQEPPTLPGALRQLSEGQDLCAALLHFAKAVQLELRADLVGLYCRATPGGELQLTTRVANGEPPADLDSGSCPSLLRRLSAGRQSMLLPRLRDPLKPDGMASFAGAPLWIEDESVGALGLWVRQPRSFLPHEVTLVETLAASAAVAIDRTWRRQDERETDWRAERRHQETKERLRRTEAQLVIARSLSSALDLQPLLKEVTRQAARACDMDCCTIHLFEGQWAVPTMSQYADGRICRKQYTAFKGLGRRRIEEVPYLANLILTRQPVIVDNPGDDPLWQHAAAVFETKTALAVPLIRQETVIGAMLLTNTQHSDPVSASQAVQATTIASQVALAIDNARFDRETQIRLEETQALLDLAQTIGSKLDRLEIARQTARTLTKLLGADSSLCFASEEATGRSLVLAGYRLPEEVRTLEPYVPLSERGRYVDQAVASGRPVAISDTASDPRFEHPTARPRPQPRSLLYAPLLSQGKELGGLCSYWWNERREFTDRELRLADAIAHQMALVLKNARHYEQAQQALADLKATQERLVQSEKFRALAEMAGGVAHDFNNLLTAILGQTEVLHLALDDGQDASEDLRSGLETIAVAAQDGAEIVRRLLNYTPDKPHARRDVSVDVNELLVHTRDVSWPRRRSKGRDEDAPIGIKIEPGEVPLVQGNPTELREVLLNLVFNAIDAMPEGGTLTLSSGMQGDRVIVQIEDTGVGISEEIQGRIFDPFFTTKGEGSSGLGLSASYGIIRRHGGLIEMESELGVGTVFAIKLPVVG